MTEQPPGGQQPDPRQYPQQPYPYPGPGGPQPPQHGQPGYPPPGYGAPYPPQPVYPPPGYGVPQPYAQPRPMPVQMTGRSVTKPAWTPGDVMWILFTCGFALPFIWLKRRSRTTITRHR